ncbi:MAG: geranylgeranylglyceryl/heptaprenylglyceryl phosphate synthase [Candidatus Helarchaeota archaeon]
MPKKRKKTKVYNYLLKKIEEEGTLHFTLIDPDLTFQTLRFIGKVIKYCTEAGTDAILVGGSTIADQFAVERVVSKIKESTDNHIPIIIFPGNINAFSKNADAVFFMSLLNSRNLYWIIQSHMIGAPMLKLWDMEAISMAYLIIEPGGTAGYVGDVRLIPRNKPKIAASYALAAEYLGFKAVYLEAGSGADKCVPIKMVKSTSNFVEIPIFVGGGINNGKEAAKFALAGASAIVQGTYIEKKVIQDEGAALKRIVKEIKTAARKRL